MNQVDPDPTATAFENLSHALAYLRIHQGRLPQDDQEFAASLLEAADRRALTQKRIRWVFVLAGRLKRAAVAYAEAPPEPPPRPYGPLQDLMVAAGARDRLPCLELVADDGEPFRIRLARHGAPKPDLLIFNEDDRLIARIVDDGASLTGSLSPLMAATLGRAAQDPVGAISAYGRLTGRCSMCRRTLTDARSVDLGYGERCAEKFGLARAKPGVPPSPPLKTGAVS